MPASALFRRFARRVRRFGTPPAPGIVLLYHRVKALDVDPWDLAVRPDHFAEQMEVLRGRWRPTALAEQVQALRGPTVARGSVAVSFDDGYADNLHCALPILDRYGIPATFFLTTEPVRTGREFWWDELERLVFAPPRLPSALSLELEGRVIRWTQDPTEVFWSDLGAPGGARHPGGDRLVLYQELWTRLHVLPGRVRRGALEQIRSWSGSPDWVRESHRPLSASEVEGLASSPLAEIGAHAVSHGALASLPDQALQEEIGKSKADLEEMLRAPVIGFSYPFGRPGTYDQRTVDHVREAGFGYACINSAQGVRAGCDAFRLPRLYVRDWDGDRFAVELERLALCAG